MASELQEGQAAASKVIDDARAALDRGEISDHVFIALRLDGIMHAMKPVHQLAARKIVREYMSLVGLSFDHIDEQVQARIYEHVQIARMEAANDEEANRG